MHPLLRNVVIGIVGLIIAGALTALALFGNDPGISVSAMLGSALLATTIGLFLFAQGWIWSGRVARRGRGGWAIVIAIGGGLMAVLAAAALAGATILVLLFYLG